MSAKRRVVELNAPKCARSAAEELRQHLLSASNELYLYELLCLQQRRPFPESLRRARAALRAEIARLERETGAPGTDQEPTDGTHR